MTEIDFALSQESPTDQIELVGTVLWNKAERVGSFKKLSLPERHFVYIDIFESEINQGGLYHFFYNASGEFTHEVLDAFYTIEAMESASILNLALREFIEIPIPKDILNRRFYMKNLKPKALSIWENLDTKLIDCKEDIVGLLITYIKTHKSKFEY
tara:strand:+ start:794 stop:1261 length:468 start_codon:yes stop_codon:yes gene_type:complete